jgi:hypothetical protein
MKISLWVFKIQGFEGGIGVPVSAFCPPLYKG